MPADFRSKTSLVGAVGTNTTLAEPAGTADGDTLAYWIVLDVATTATMPSGWTSVRTGNWGTTYRWYVAVIARGASAPDLTWTHVSQWRSAELLCFTGVDTSDIVDAISAGAVQSAGAISGVVDPPAVTAVDTDALAVAWHMHWGGAPGGGWTAPSGYTLRAGNYSGAAFGIATKQLSGAGSENPGTFGGTPGATEVTVADTFTLTSAADAPPLQTDAPETLRVVQTNLRLN